MVSLGYWRWLAGASGFIICGCRCLLSPARRLREQAGCRCSRRGFWLIRLLTTFRVNFIMAQTSIVNTYSIQWRRTLGLWALYLSCSHCPYLLFYLLGYCCDSKRYATNVPLVWCLGVYIRKNLYLNFAWGKRLDSIQYIGWVIFIFEVSCFMLLPTQKVCY